MNNENIEYNNFTLNDLKNILELNEKNKKHIIKNIKITTIDFFGKENSFMFLHKVKNNLNTNNIKLHMDFSIDLTDLYVKSPKNNNENINKMLVIKPYHIIDINEIFPEKNIKIILDFNKIDLISLISLSFINITYHFINYNYELYNGKNNYYDISKKIIEYLKYVTDTPVNLNLKKKIIIKSNNGYHGEIQEILFKLYTNLNLKININNIKNHKDVYENPKLLIKFYYSILNQKKEDNIEIINKNELFEKLTFTISTSENMINDIMNYTDITKNGIIKLLIKPKSTIINDIKDLNEILNLCFCSYLKKKFNIIFSTISEIDISNILKNVSKINPYIDDKFVFEDIDYSKELNLIVDTYISLFIMMRSGNGFKLTGYFLNNYDSEIGIPFYNYKKKQRTEIKVVDNINFFSKEIEILFSHIIPSLINKNTFIIDENDDLFYKNKVINFQKLLFKKFYDLKIINKNYDDILNSEILEYEIILNDTIWNNLEISMNESSKTNNIKNYAQIISFNRDYNNLISQISYNSQQNIHDIYIQILAETLVDNFIFVESFSKQFILIKNKKIKLFNDINFDNIDYNITDKNTQKIIKKNIKEYIKNIKKKFEKISIINFEKINIVNLINLTKLTEYYSGYISITYAQLLKKLFLKENKSLNLGNELRLKTKEIIKTLKKKISTTFRINKTLLKNYNIFKKYLIKNATHKNSFIAKLYNFIPNNYNFNLYFDLSIEDEFNLEEIKFALDLYNNKTESNIFYISNQIKIPITESPIVLPEIKDYNNNIFYNIFEKKIRKLFITKNDDNKNIFNIKESEYKTKTKEEVLNILKSILNKFKKNEFDKLNIKDEMLENIKKNNIIENYIFSSINNESSTIKQEIINNLKNVLEKIFDRTIQKIKKILKSDDPFLNIFKNNTDLLMNDDIILIFFLNSPYVNFFTYNMDLNNRRMNTNNFIRKKLNNFYEKLNYYPSPNHEDRALLHSNETRINKAFFKDKLIIFNFNFANKFNLYKFLISYENGNDKYKNYYYITNNNELWTENIYYNKKDEFKNYCYKRMKLTPNIKKFNSEIRYFGRQILNFNFRLLDSEKFNLPFFKNFIEQIFELKNMKENFITIYEDKYFKNLWENKGEGFTIILKTENNKIIEWNWKIKVNQDNKLIFDQFEDESSLLFKNGNILNIEILYDNYINNSILNDETYILSYSNKTIPMVKCKIIKMKKLDDLKKKSMLNELIFSIDKFHKKIINPDYAWKWKILNSKGQDAGALKRQSFSVFANELSQFIFEPIYNNCDYYNFKADFFKTKYYKKYQDIKFNESNILNFVGSLFAVSLLRKTNIPISLDPFIYYILKQIFNVIYINLPTNEEIKQIIEKYIKDEINKIKNSPDYLKDVFINKFLKDYLEIYDNELIGKECNHYYKLKNLVSLTQEDSEMLLKKYVNEDYRNENNLNIDYNKIINIPWKISDIPCDENSVKKWKSSEDNVYSQNLANQFCKSKNKIYDIDYEKIGFDKENNLIKISDTIKVEANTCRNFKDRVLKVNGKETKKICAEDIFKINRRKEFNKIIREDSKKIQDKIKINDKYEYIKNYILNYILKGDRRLALIQFCIGFIEIIPNNLYKNFKDFSIRDYNYLITGEKIMTANDIIENLSFKYYLGNYDTEKKEFIKQIQNKISEKIKNKIKDEGEKNVRYFNLFSKMMISSYNKPISGFEKMFEFSFKNFEKLNIKQKYGLDEIPNIEKILELNVDQIEEIHACFGEATLRYNFEIHDYLFSNKNEDIDTFINNDKSIQSLINQFSLENIIKFPGVIDDSMPFTIG
jgi:hypothetical protein